MKESSLLWSVRLVCAALLVLMVVRSPLTGSESEEREGAGSALYQWDTAWPKPEAADFGSTHGGVAVDAQGRIFLCSDTAPAVRIFSAQGERLGSWGEDLAGGLHGMALVREGEREVLYLAHTARHEVLVASLEGEVLRRIPWPQASGLYATLDQYNPTSVAVADDGMVFVADGYGKSYVHRFDAGGRWLSAFGGPGKENGQLNTPHGIAIDRRQSPATLLVADRENGRLQRFGLDGSFLEVIQVPLRRPCGVAVFEGFVAVPDLAGRVTLIGAKNELVEHLFDNPTPELRANNGVGRELWKQGEFIAPHGLAFDAKGNLYVQDWLALGRVTRLLRSGVRASEAQESK